MLAWFKDKISKKPDHPMYNGVMAQKLLEDLPNDEPLKALEEISCWLDSVKDTPGFRVDDRLEVVKLLDERGQEHQRRICHEYMTASRMGKIHENRLWISLSNFWHQVGEAYLVCLNEYQEGVEGSEAIKEELSLVVVRILRALTTQKKWFHMRYRQVETRIWTDIFKLVRMAESMKLARTLVVAYPFLPRTTVYQEFARSLMIEMASLQSLRPLQIEIVDRIATVLAGYFAFGNELSGDTPYGVDLSGFAGPVRYRENLIRNPDFRCVGSGTSIPKLVAWKKMINQGKTLPEFKPLEFFGAAELRTVIEHLETYWGVNVPQRKHERKPQVHRLHVVHGYSDIRRKVASIDTLTLSSDEENKDILHLERVDLKLYGFVTDKTRRQIAEASRARQELAMKDDALSESWVTEDISEGGIGAEISPQDMDWVEAGKLIGYKSQDGDRWKIGVIRHFSRDDRLKCHVGVQNISTEPVSARLRPLKKADLSVWERLSESPAYEYLNALLLPSTGAKPLRLLMESNSFSLGNYYEMIAQGKRFMMQVTELDEQGEGYAIVKLLLMAKVEEDNRKQVG